MSINVTPNLKLSVPDFDQVPWDTDVNTNWAVLDAAVGLFTAIPDMTGVWKNATAYAYGQSAVDSADSSIWSCVQSHTSSAAPLSFANERVSFPGRWASTGPSAQFWADQAAASSSSAAASAAAAANSAAAAVGALPLTGGTMTGFITLHADPSAAMHAATKEYVDARVGGVGYLPITGGTLTGPLYAGGNGIGYMNIAVADRILVGFGWNGAIYATVNGAVWGNLATQSYVYNGFLPLTGGNLTGTIYTTGELQAASTVRLASSGAFFTTNASVTAINWDSSGWQLQYIRASGTLRYLDASSRVLFNFDGSGNLQALNNIAALGDVFSRGGGIYWGAADRSLLYSDNSTLTDMRMLDNYMWRLNWSTGVLQWLRYDGGEVLNINPNGNLRANQHITAVGGLFAINGAMSMNGDASVRVMQFGTNFYWTWNISTGNLDWVTTSGNIFELRPADAAIGNNVSVVFGNGAFVNISDERIKQNMVDAPWGLPEVLQINPIRFNRVDKTLVETGFSAQQLESVIPDAVYIPGAVDGLKGVHIDPIVAALVNGMKELNTRLTALEAP
jgi:hypothetical protein